MPETMGELSILLNVMNNDIQEIKQDVKDTKEQAIKTNGRVNKHDDEFVHLHQSLLLMQKKDDELSLGLEEEKKWRYMIIGGLIITNLLILPPVGYIITKLIDRLF